MRQINHLAVIMDGNGRWAAGRGRPRFWGHVRGAKVVPEIVEEADRLGVKSLTLFAFSSENWSRPRKEIELLYRLLAKFLKDERERVLKNRIRFKVIGDISPLPESTQKLIRDLELLSSNASGLKLNMAFGYGARQEILRGLQGLMADYPNPSDLQSFDPLSFGRYLLTSDCGDVDLLIRTGGEKRLSNFMLWQLAYAELYFTDLPWPQFNKHHLESILQEVEKRKRNFGSLGTAKDFQESLGLAQRAKLWNSQSEASHVRN